MKRKDFIKVMNNALANKQGIVVKITIPGCDYPEEIFNPAENVEFKRNYYLNAYNENMELSHNRDIKIVDAKTC